MSAPKVEIYYRNALDLFALLLWLYLCYAAFIAPDMYWDTWSYHLPFASFLWNIGGGKEHFIPSRIFQMRYGGFPLFAEWLEGALWTLSGDMRAANLANPLVLGVLCAAAWRWLGVRLYWLLPALLAFPLIGLQILTTYTDIIAGGLAACAIVNAAHLYEKLHTPAPFANRWPWCSFAAFAACSCNSKIQSWAFLLPILAFIMLRFLLLARTPRLRAQLFAFGIILALICNYTTLRNVWNYGNPIFPLALTMNPEKSPEGDTENLVPYYSPGYLPNSYLARPLYFWLSVTEIDWFIRHINYFYLIDSGQDDRGTTMTRTGGLFAPYACFQFVLLVVLSCKRRLYYSLTIAQRFCVPCFALATVLVMWMPGAHELRYNLGWPMLMVIVNGCYLNHLGARARLFLTATTLLTFATSQTLLPINRSIFSLQPQIESSPAQMRGNSPPEILNQLHDGQRTCLESSSVSTFMWFRYAPAIIGGTHTIVAPSNAGQSCANSPNEWAF